jgi:hypothetical protein
MRLAADGRVQRALGVVLGVDVSRLEPCRLDRQALRTAFRRQAHRLHPDKALVIGLSEQALAYRFRELKHAYDYLVALLDVPRVVAGVSTPTAAEEVPAAPPNASSATQRSAASASAPPHPRPGQMPRRRLRFAQYLYYAGVIDWNTLLRARRWQRRTRPYLGEIAREIGALSVDDVDYVLRHRRASERFGEAALRLRRLDHVRLLTILGRQHRLARPIGRYFVEHDILTLGELELWLQRHWAHNLSVAAAELGFRGASACSGPAADGHATKSRQEAP